MITMITKCEPAGGSRLMLGWGCCKCRTYNGEQRDACKCCGHSRCDVEVKAIAPYTDPPLPPSGRARGAARVAKEMYDSTREAASCGATREALRIAERYPQSSLLHFACLSEACKCGGICAGPKECDTDVSEHEYVEVPCEGIMVLGYRDGLTPSVVAAILDGRSFDECRAMAAPPEQVQ